MSDQYACTECGGLDVEGQKWVRLRDNRLRSDAGGGGRWDYWCPDCHEHTAIELVDVYDRPQPRPQYCYMENGRREVARKLTPGEVRNLQTAISQCELAKAAASA